MHLSRISLKNWRNFRSVECTVGRRVFVIGPNASGKSNFLDALRFLRDLAEIGLRKSVEKRGGVSYIRCLAARASPEIGVGVDIAGDDGIPRWRYELEFSQDSQRRPSVRRETVQNLDSGGKITDRHYEKEPDKGDPLLLTQTHLEQISTNRDFREVVEFFGSISYQHVVPQAVRDPRGFSPGPVSDDPFGRDLLLRIHATPEQARRARLRQIEVVLGQAVPQLGGLEVELDAADGTPHLSAKYEHWRPHGANQNESQLSDGTLRLFGLLWALMDGGGPLLLEEPELSLHVEVVRQIPQLFTMLQQAMWKMKKKGGTGFRQTIISTHSDALLGDTGIGVDEVLRIEPSTEGSRIEPPTDADRSAMGSGLSAAEVLLPKTSPSHGQLEFDLLGDG